MGQVSTLCVQKQGQMDWENYYHLLVIILGKGEKVTKKLVRIVFPYESEIGEFIHNFRKPHTHHVKDNVRKICMKNEYPF